MNTYTIERDIEINAPVEVVWRTITEPELICTWFADLVELDARPGAVGSLTFRADSDSPHVVGITVVAADRPHRFSYRWVYPPGERATEGNSTLVTFTLVAEGDELTRLRVVESGLEEMDMADDEKEQFLKDHRHGWQVQGDRLRDLFVSGHASSP
ncbi:MAG: SRPBCC domain-containing protein [Tepidiformaceae bacterium]